MTISEAKINTKYLVVDVIGSLKEKRRLLDMGFAPNSEIYVAKIAPFGGTILVVIRQFMVALRLDAASLIQVKEVA